MTHDDIIRMAREAGLTEVVRQHDDGTVTLEVPHLPRVLMFAALVAAAEREACAVAGGAAAMAGQDYIGVAAAIRARGENK